jgi:glycosyltransferase involved in cell wall biosynthesis
VLYVVSLFPCWSETFIAREIAALVGLGLDVRILSLRHPSEALVQKDAEGLLDRVLYPPRTLGATLRTLASLARHPFRHARIALLALRLARKPLSFLKTLVTWWRTLLCEDAVREAAPDLLHAHWATYPSTAALILGELLPLPWSFTSHAHDLFVEDQGVGRKLRESALAVTISGFNKRYLSERWGFPEKIEVVHCGIPVEAIAFEPWGRSIDEVLAVGRLEPIKGFEVLLEACALLRSRGRDVRCTLVGDGPLRGRLEELVRERGLSGVVTLTGALAQGGVLGHLRRAAAFVLPSVVAPNGARDGIPVALMEAMAAGAPVVSTRLSGIPELVQDGWSGLLAEPGDASGLAERIEAILTDPRRAAELARNARSTVEDQFNVATEAQRLRELFLRAAAARVHG